MNNFPFVSIDSPYSSIDIPFMGTPFVLNVVVYFRAMSLIVHASSELRDLNYVNFQIEIIPCILTMFDGDIMFESPPPPC
jgi:hypothetical protein